MKINKETQALNDTLNKMDLTDMYRTCHPKTTECTFFSSAHGTFSRIDHILGHKSSCSKFKKIETILSIFSDYNAMRLEIIYREKNVKNTNTWRLNNTLLNNQEITEEMKQKINKETEALNGTIDQIDLIDIYRTFDPKMAEYIFFSSAHRTFSRTDHILGHKSSLSKFKKIEIILSISSDHSAMRLDMNYTKKSVKNTNTWS